MRSTPFLVINRLIVHNIVNLVLDSIGKSARIGITKRPRKTLARLSEPDPITGISGEGLQPIITRCPRWIPFVGHFYCPYPAGGGEA